MELDLIKVSVDLSALLKNKYIKKCSYCYCELDIEDYFFNNICYNCGASQGYDKEYFENSDLNYCEVLL